jgi:peptidoglycan hydrolase CwlO-like protein
MQRKGTRNYRRNKTKINSLKKEINELSKNNEQTITEFKQIKSELKITKKELAEKAEYVKTFEEILEDDSDDITASLGFPIRSEINL